MPPSTPPPPPSDASTTLTRPLLHNPNPPRPQNPNPFPSRLPSNPNPNYPQLAPRSAHLHPHLQDPSQLLYPVASSGRGFLPRPVALPAGQTSQRPPFVFPYLDQSQGNPSFVRPNHFPHVLIGSGTGSAGNASGAAVMPGVVKGIPVPSPHQTRVAPSLAPISDNGHKDLRDRSKDGDFIIITNRKVRITENASLYSLCRSWLRNGSPEEIQQPQYLDTVRSLPKPLPADSPDKKARDEEGEDKDTGSVEHLSEKELLQRHIKRAKKVRSQLREERLHRITRYKTRLALLLPPMVEHHFKNGSTAAN